MVRRTQPLLSCWSSSWICVRLHSSEKRLCMTRSAMERRRVTCRCCCRCLADSEDGESGAAAKEWVARCEGGPSVVEEERGEAGVPLTNHKTRGVK